MHKEGLCSNSGEINMLMMMSILIICMQFIMYILCVEHITQLQAYNNEASAHLTQAALFKCGPAQVVIQKPFE
jgi:hypothetical protein